MDEELEKQRQLLMDAKIEIENKDNKEDDETGDKAKSSVFANFKKYNTGGSKTTENKVGNRTKTKNVIVCDRANRYSYRGVYDENKNVVNKFPEKQTDSQPKKISVADFLKHRKNYSSHYDENSNYDNFSDDSEKSDGSNNSSINVNEIDGSASDGFWRFLNIRYVANELDNKTETETETETKTKTKTETEELVEVNDPGAFWINGKKYSSRQAYHKAVVNMNTTAGVSNADKDSDNSYDVLECDTNNNEDVNIPDDTDDTDEEKNDDIVESGMRNRTNSVASDVSNASSGGMRSSWLGW